MNPLASAASYMQFQAMRGALRLAPAWFERRLLNAAARAAESVTFTPGRVFVDQMIRFGRDLLPRACPQCRRKVLDNFLASAIRGKRVRTAYHRRTGLQPPYFLVISPTMRCNLACEGCYAARYDKEVEMPLDLVDRILREARAMGMYFMTISGGEPFLRPDLLDLMEKYDDMYFQVFTNGTLIDDTLADRLARMGHIFPAISVEGLEAQTDAHRGPGTFGRVMAAMDRLRERGVLFGFSATATRENSELLVSDEFIDFYRRKGCCLGWYLNRVPVGGEPDLSHMPTPEQRIERRRPCWNCASGCRCSWWTSGTTAPWWAGAWPPAGTTSTSMSAATSSRASSASSPSTTSTASRCTRSSTARSSAASGPASRIPTTTCAGAWSSTTRNCCANSWPGTRASDQPRGRPAAGCRGRRPRPVRR